MALAAPEKTRLILSVAVAAIGQVCGIVPFYLAYRLVAALAQGPLNPADRHWLYRLVAAGAVAVVLKNSAMALSTVLSHLAAYDLLHALRMRLAGKLATLPLGYFDRKNTGQIKKVVSEDVENLEVFFAHNFPDFMGALIYLLVAASVLLAVDWRLALAAMAVIPLGIGFQGLVLSRDKKEIGQWFSAVEKMNAVMVEYIQGIAVIKAFNHTVRSFAKFSDAIRACHRMENRTCAKWFLPMSVFYVSIAANLLVVLPAGAWLYLRGMVSLETFVFFLLMGIGFGDPLQIMLQIGGQMEKNLEGLSRIRSVLDADSLPEEKPGQVPGHDISGARVRFGYTRNVPVIRDVDFAVPRGRFIALVGPSGSGKSTLARLICRFWDVDSGTIRWGDADIRQVETGDLMARLSLIFQEVRLFNDTVTANLVLGRNDLGPETVRQAAESAQCHDFIRKLPHGYDTVVGEKGTRLSGGEKQRLSIARALLKDAPVLILDEATAAIDPENETLIQKAIDNLVNRKTLIVIAHRLSTVIRADEILVIDKGRIEARGTHEQLLNTSELYRTLWTAHTAARQWEIGEEKC